MIVIQRLFIIRRFSTPENIFIFQCYHTLKFIYEWNHKAPQYLFNRKLEQIV